MGSLRATIEVDTHAVRVHAGSAHTVLCRGLRVLCAFDAFDGVAGAVAVNVGQRTLAATCAGKTIATVEVAQPEASMQ
jgi:hypothetical protein